MRYLVPLLLVLPALADSPKKAAAFLLKDLAKYDPTVLPEDDRTQAQVKQIRKDQKFEKNLHKVKRACLDDHVKRYTEAIAAIGAIDNAASAKVLCEAFVLAGDRAAVADAARDQCVKDWKLCVQSHDAVKNMNNLRKGTAPVYHRAQTNEKIWSAYTMALLGLRLECARFLRGFESKGARDYLAKNALAKAKSKELRAKAAEILTADAQADPAPILLALKRERDPGVRAALLIAASRLEKARSAGATVAPFLKDRSERVRIAAARALERMHVVEGVEPLIKQMATETGLAKAVMARALESMTGQKFGTHPENWLKWWAGQSGKLLGGGLPPRSDEVPSGVKGEGHFYGIPQVSLKIIYIIDVSGSMKHDVGGKTRLEACKTELSRAISQLPRLAHFNVLLYSHDVKAWNETMVVAGPVKKGGPENKTAAKAFFKDATPNGNTNIYDALRKAFEIAGTNAKKKGPLAADTIYLLTDGAPTEPSGKKVDTNKILEAARKWNAGGLVTVHTIGIGKDLNRPFLEQLAKEHNGKFIWKKGD